MLIDLKPIREALEAVVGEYLHWRKVNPHIKGGENYLKRLRDAIENAPTDSVVDVTKAARAILKIVLSTDDKFGDFSFNDCNTFAQICAETWRLKWKS